MQRKFAKLSLLVIGFVFVFTGLAASANFTLNLRTSSNAGAATVTGNITATESNLPLATGTIIVDGQHIDIIDGQFVIEDILAGDHQASIDGPYRKQKNTILRVKPGDNEIHIAVNTSVPQAEIDMLARITRAEAEGESRQGQVAVAATVLNRVLSDRYPAGIREVVYQVDSGRYQYSPVRDGRINLQPRASDYIAAHKALAGHDPSLGATGFFNPAKTRDRWVRSQPVTTVIGGHRFFSY